MSIRELKRDIKQLKQIAAIEKKQSENDYLKNLTDEELQEQIDNELAKLGFKSQEEFYDAAKKFILEKDEHANVTHEIAINKHIFELFKDCKMFEEFMLKYSSVEWTE
jgi:hypothetical protein